VAEKFQPLGPKDLKGDQKELVEESEWYWLKHPVVETYHGPWTEYIAYLEGNQYTYYSKALKGLVDVTPLVEREIKNVYNRILPLIRQQWGEMRYPHSFYVVPSTTESEDKKAAGISSVLIEYTNVLRQFNHKINFAKLWTLVTGNVFWKEWWNKNLFGYVEGPNKKPTKESGDVDYNWVNPFNVRPDPHGKTREEWRWLIEGKLVPKTALEDEFGLPRGTLPEEAFATAGQGLFQRPDAIKPRELMSLRMERWERGSGNRSKGRFSVIGGGFLLWDDESPAPEADIPYFQLMGLMPILEEQWGDSSVRIAQDGQRQINRLGSMIDEHIQYFKPKAMIPRGALISREKAAFCRAGIDFVEFNPTGYGNPYWASPPPLPEIIIRWLNFHETEIETETSVRKTLQGQLPKYASRASGELFRGLVAQDQKVLYPAIEDQEVQLQAAMKYRLELIQKHYSQPRMVKITGKQKEPSVIYVKGAEIRNNTDVRIQSGVDLMRSIEAKREVVDAMIQKGMITDPKKVFELLDLKGLEEYMEDEYIDERQAYRILDFFKQGKPYIVPSLDDNHDVHFKIFNNFRKTEEFDTLDKKIQDLILKRIEDHKGYLEQKAQASAEMARPETAPGPAAPGAPTAMPEGALDEAIRQIAAEGGIG
jgi:hypothetical protein